MLHPGLLYLQVLPECCSAAPRRAVPITVLCICNKVCEQKAVTRSPHRRGSTAIPSAFAVLMITSLYLLGACTGRSAGFSFEYVSRGMPELVEEIAAVGDQSPGIGIIGLHVGRQLRGWSTQD